MTSHPAADPCGLVLGPAAVRQPAVRRPPGGSGPVLRGLGCGSGPPRLPRHLQPEPAGEGGLAGGDVEHHADAALGEADLSRASSRWGPGLGENVPVCLLCRQ